MKKTVLAALLLGASAAAYAVPVVTVAEGVNGADGTAAFATLTQLPAPSGSDALNGNTPTQIEVSYTGWNSGNPGMWASHNGIPGTDFINFAAFVDGAGTTAYPGQLPADFFPDGSEGPIDNPPTRMFWTLAGAADLINVTFYGYNLNSGVGAGDCRAAIIADVYVTTDATPTAGGAWTLVNADQLYPSAAPKSLTYLSNNTNNGIAYRFADDTGAPLASNITGLRVDIYGSGFGTEVRDPSVDIGAGKTGAVSSPFIAEIDAVTAAANVGDWVFLD